MAIENPINLMKRYVRGNSSILFESLATHNNRNIQYYEVLIPSVPPEMSKVLENVAIKRGFRFVKWETQKSMCYIVRVPYDNKLRKAEAFSRAFGIRYDLFFQREAFSGFSDEELSVQVDARPGKNENQKASIDQFILRFKSDNNFFNTKTLPEFSSIVSKSPIGVKHRLRHLDFVYASCYADSESLKDALGKIDQGISEVYLKQTIVRVIKVINEIYGGLSEEV